jgi:tetratricopeptide (TPR) repeat protein
MHSAREIVLLAKLKNGEGDSEDITMQLAILYQELGYPLEAIPYLQKLLAGTQDADKVCYYNFVLGQIMEQVEDYEAAASYYSQALAVETKDEKIWYFIHNNLGYCLNALGRFEEAGEFLLKALKIFYNLPNAYKNYGICLEGQGDYSAAVHSYMMSALADPSDTRAIRHLNNLLKRHPELKIDMLSFNKVVKKRKNGHTFEECINMYFPVYFPETKDDTRNDKI